MLMRKNSKVNLREIFNVAIFITVKIISFREGNKNILKLGNIFFNLEK